MNSIYHLLGFLVNGFNLKADQTLFGMLQYYTFFVLNSVGLMLGEIVTTTSAFTPTMLLKLRTSASSTGTAKVRTAITVRFNLIKCPFCLESPI